jgi:glycosyltransferase involved in cell wall biosynthesis
MRILWFNWRDKKNPDAGGAEVFTHEVMRRLAERGHGITLFTAAFPGCLNKEILDGVEIVRMGGRFGVYKNARKFYEMKGEQYDIVVDEINTRPFMTPKFIGKNKKLVALFHQLAKEFWFYETRFPVNYLGYYILERMWLANYKDVPIITVSNSSKEDLDKLGFTRIMMVPQGLSIIPSSEVPMKASAPTIVFIGRMKKAKLPQHALDAFALIKKEIPESRMQVIGDGYLRAELEKRYSDNNVKFYGYIEPELKHKILAEAHLILMPAVREGWGLVVTEANAYGTPAVAYNVPGVRDSVQDGQTGILTKENNPVQMAHAAIELLKNKKELDRLSSNALNHSRQFNWDSTANRFEELLAGL